MVCYALEEFVGGGFQMVGFMNYKMGEGREVVFGGGVCVIDV